ncbi:MAG: HNH endonuclease [Nostoc sp.]
MTEIKTPRDSTIRRLFALSMNRCAFPSCTNAIIDSSTNNNIILGEVCHICAQNPGGLRYNAQQTSEERHSFENLILLCKNHHKVIDAKENLHKYTVEYLTCIKADHEENARKAEIEVSALSDSLVAELQKTMESQLRTTVYMDFHGAQLKAGGEGGSHGGAGGEGGIINIVGVTPAGFHEPIDVHGREGQVPGGGGGGGGLATYRGRPADVDDLENGLQISAIFLANAIQVQGLFSVLGGGWAYYEVPSLPYNLQLNLLCVVETGTIPINTLLRIDYSVKDAEGHTALVSHYDLPISQTTAQIRRWSVPLFLSLKINCIGIWRIMVSSGSLPLASHDIEFRLVG